MTSVANGQFLDLNASGSLGQQQPRLQRIHPGVVRRNRPPEPDRSHVEGAPPPSPPSPLAPVETVRIKPGRAVEMAGKKKKRVFLDPNTREVGIARVNKLVAAGNPAEKAIKSVAKELGVSASTVANWRSKAKKAAPKAAKKRGRRVEQQIAEHVRAPKGVVGAPSLRIEGLDDFVRQELRSGAVRAIVREELEAMFGRKGDE